MSAGDVAELFRDHPVKMASAMVTICAGVLWAAAFWNEAQDVHAQTAENKRTIEQLIEFQRQVVKEKEIEREQDRKLQQEIARLCLLKKITDPEECAKVGVRLD